MRPRPYLRGNLFHPRSPGQPARVYFSPGPTRFPAVRWLGRQLQSGGRGVPFLLAFTTLLASCDGPPETGLVGPSAAVSTATHLVFSVQPNATTATAAIF